MPTRCGRGTAPIRRRCRTMLPLATYVTALIALTGRVVKQLGESKRSRRCHRSRFNHRRRSTRPSIAKQRRPYESLSRERDRQRSTLADRVPSGRRAGCRRRRGPRLIGPPFQRSDIYESTDSRSLLYVCSARHRWRGLYGRYSTRRRHRRRPCRGHLDGYDVDARRGRRLTVVRHPAAGCLVSLGADAVRVGCDHRVRRHHDRLDELRIVRHGLPDGSGLCGFVVPVQRIAHRMQRNVCRHHDGQRQLRKLWERVPRRSVVHEWCVRVPRAALDVRRAVRDAHDRPRELRHLRQRVRCNAIVQRGRVQFALRRRHYVVRRELRQSHDRSEQLRVVR